MRKRIAAEDADAAEALEIFCYRVRGYVGPYAAAPDQVDAIVFTAGIGENDPEIRAGVCAGLAATGSNSTPSATGRRGADPRTVSADASQVAVLVVRTNEEREIARQALALAISSEGRR